MKISSWFSKLSFYESGPPPYDAVATGTPPYDAVATDTKLDDAQCLQQALAFRKREMDKLLFMMKQFIREKSKTGATTIKFSLTCVDYVHPYGLDKHGVIAYQPIRHLSFEDFPRSFVDWIVLADGFDILKDELSTKFTNIGQFSKGKRNLYKVRDGKLTDEITRKDIAYVSWVWDCSGVLTEKADNMV